ncbi:hypothetical protein BDV41DRAFT_581891 [Aspergillus transmontanensis]|uniref:Uncharacterized protein n=1 Tax=Aspergillus transmontanensis TaxID=1034304 RepID=A0A5N6VHE3_9EURO|nr:hypothetical protein BDV41DRAFT_581891 [Aspergillus transmontanensis]
MATPGYYYRRHVLGRLSSSKPGLGRIALRGERSGGWLAVQSCLKYPKARIKCVITSSTSLDSQIPYHTIPGPKRIMGQPPIPARQAEMTI